MVVSEPGQGRVAVAPPLMIEIAQVLRTRGAWYMHLPRRGRARRWLPDLVACYKGRLIALDVEGGRGPGPTAAQQREFESLDRAGAVTLVAGSAKEVSAILDDLDRNPPEILALERLLT